MDLLDDLGVMLALLEVPELVVRPPLAAFLPLSALVLGALGLVLFFGLVFAVVEGVGGLAFCEVETADLAVSEGGCEFVARIVVMRRADLVRREALGEGFFAPGFEGGLHIDGLAQDVARLLRLLALILVRVAVEVRCLVAERLAQVGVFVGQFFELVEVGGGKGLITIVFGRVLGPEVGLVDCELDGALLEVDGRLERIAFAGSGGKDGKLLLHLLRIK